MEINLRHGDPLELADQVFLFKRTIREAALRHDMYATFMAKPMQDEAGIGDAYPPVGGRHGRPARTSSRAETASRAELFRSFIGGMQHYVPKALVMMAPYVNSYRRLTPEMAAPVNTAWGYDNRTTAFRMPTSGPAARRLENRLPSSDANPTWRSPRRWPAAISAWSMGSCRPARRPKDRQRGRDLAAARTAWRRCRCWKANAISTAVLGREFTATLCRRQARRIRDLHAGDQPVGTGVPAAQRLRRANHDLSEPHLAPGISFYGTRRRRRAARISDAARRHDCDVVIVGGGFTGLRRRRTWRPAARTWCWSKARFGDGASGRNGGQMNTGQRAWPEEQEADFGFERAKALFELAERGEDASAQLFRKRYRRRLPAGPALGAHKSAMSRTTAHAEDHGGAFGYPHMRFHGARAD
jgi:hypothetical protein